ncbi:MAG TPA: membrane protein insertase YidC [Candidatus Binatia bacterium]|jgi:YidC/Oxa1 family membrane protein insertase|nr:membrane protein insertase YidC [Candidatus Binatia bacterium]
MDRTSIIVVVLCLLLMGLWFVVVPKMYPPKPLSPGATNAPTATLTTNQTGTSAASPAMPEAPLPPPQLVANTNVPEELREVTNANAHYTFTSYGGGLKLIELLRYPETVGTRFEKARTNQVATLNMYTPAPTLALLDGEPVQGDGIFKLTRTGDTIRAEKQLTNGLTIIKDFEISTNYLIAATVRLENHSTKPLNLPAQEWIIGTATPMGPRDNGQAVGVLWYNGSKATDVGTVSYFSPSGGCFSRRIPPTDYSAGESNVVWVAAHNQFFALAVMPQQPALKVVVRRLDLPRPTGEDARLVATNAPTPQGYEAAMVYPALTLGTNQTVQRQIFLFAGPKEYQTLARVSDRFNNNIDLVMNFGWAGFVSKALLLGMNWLHEMLRISYGWAIVMITMLIKLVFWPLTAASTRSAKRMQALQPQVKALQEKYKDDPMKSQRKMMELWKENKVSPMSGCLPMVIQIPVFFGFYSMIRSAIELRGASFLWVQDLSQSDTLFVIPGLGFLPFFGVPGVGLPFNLLPLIMGATMLWQTHLAPPSPGMDPAQAKMMRYLPLIFIVGLYNFSAGLTLYWTVNNLLTILQTKLTKTIQDTNPPGKAPVLTPPPKKRK